MVKYKNIRIPKRGGGTRLQRVQVLASGKYKFVKNPNSKVRRNPKPKTKKKRRRTYMPKKKKRGGGKSIQRTVFKLVRMSALLGPAVGQALRKDRTPEDKVYEILLRYTGGWFKGDGPIFQPQALLEGYGPYLMTTLIHKGVQKVSGIISRL